jgi:GAF domain-containing protein
MGATATESGREIILRGRSLRDVLIALSKLAERELSGAAAGYTLVDPTGSFIDTAVFPSLPPMFQESIVSIPVSEPSTGTCVEAIRTGTPVISNDILGDARFNPKWRDLCLRCGIKSVKSIPIRKDGGATEGTFVLGYKELANDALWNRELMDQFADLAFEAIRLYRTLAVKSAAG